MHPPPPIGVNDGALAFGFVFVTVAVIAPGVGDAVVGINAVPSDNPVGAPPVGAAVPVPGAAVSGKRILVNGGATRVVDGSEGGYARGGAACDAGAQKCDPIKAASPGRRPEAGGAKGGGGP